MEHSGNAGKSLTGALTKALATEFAQDGITVDTVSPGYVAHGCSSR